jgi:hypothetical protein
MTAVERRSGPPLPPVHPRNDSKNLGTSFRDEGGTPLLDEVSETSPALHAKLLKVLEGDAVNVRLLLQRTGTCGGACAWRRFGRTCFIGSTLGRSRSRPCVAGARTSPS